MEVRYYVMADSLIFWHVIEYNRALVYKVPCNRRWRDHDKFIPLTFLPQQARYHYSCRSVLLLDKECKFSDIPGSLEALLELLNQEEKEILVRDPTLTTEETLLILESLNHS